MYGSDDKDDFEYNLKDLEIQYDEMDIVSHAEKADYDLSDVDDDELATRLYWDPFYEHAMEAEISHPEYSPTFAVSNSSLGLDFKKTPEGDWELIEATPLVFGMEGFSDGYRWGDISDDVERHLDSMFGTFNHDLDNAMLNFEDKRFAADHLPSARDYETVESFDGDPDSDIVYIKNPREDCGEGVEVVEATKFEDRTTEEVVEELGMDLDADLMIEENVPSEGVTLEDSGVGAEGDEDEYDACMRYVVDISLTGEGMNAKFLGGYWRTAPEPKRSDAPLKERRIANLKEGEAVSASPTELREATQKAAEITKEIHSALIQESVEGEITPEHGKKYLPEIGFEWKSDVMTDPFMERLGFSGEGYLS
jgi:hypothetical protein